MITPIVISEKINVITREQLGNVIVPQVQDFSAARNPSRPRYALIRNPVDDTFNLEFSRQFNVITRNVMQQYMSLPYVNVNNQIEFYGYNSPIALQIVPNAQVQDWKVHRTLLKEMQLRKMSTIVMGEDLFRFEANRFTTPLGHGVIYRSINFLAFEEIEKNAIATFDDVIELDSVREIGFAQMTSPTISIDGPQNIVEDTTFVDVSTKPTFKYSRLFIKPIAPDYFRGDQDVAEIYGDCGDDANWISQISVKNATLKSTSLKTSKLNLAYEKYNGTTRTIDVGELKPKLLGKLKITDPTYYDYVTGETKVGFAPNSIIGEIIPYSFKGNYTRELDLDFNGVFKDMKLAFTNKVDQPILGASNGIVRLSVETDQTRQSVLSNFFTSEDIKFIKNNRLDLNGLMRLAKHEG